MMKPTMSVKECADALQIPYQCLRELIKKGKMPFAVAINITGKRWQYRIFRERFNAWLRGECNEYCPTFRTPENFNPFKDSYVE